MLTMLWAGDIKKKTKLSLDGKVSSTLKPVGGRVKSLRLLSFVEGVEGRCTQKIMKSITSSGSLDVS